MEQVLLNINKNILTNDEIIDKIELNYDLIIKYLDTNLSIQDSFLLLI